jgi:hypothetical protein
MAARAIDIVRTGPSTRFVIDYETADDAANNRTLIKVWRGAYNGPAGDSTSHYDDRGRHVWWSNGNPGNARDQDPFLPGGYAQNQNRWNDYYTYYQDHDANGNAQLQFGMNVAYYIGGGPGLNSSTDYYSAVYNLSRYPQVPGTMAAPTFSGIGPHAVTITWVAPSRGHADINNYDLHVCESAVHDPVTCTAWYNWTGSTATSKAFTDLKRNTVYFVAMRAQNGDGAGGWSPWASFTTSQFDIPSTPTGYGFSDKTSTSVYTTLPTIADNGGGSITGMEVEYNTTASSTGSTIVGASALRSILINNRAVGSAIYYRMRVRNSVTGGGWSAWGGWVNTTLLSNTPSQVATFTVDGIDDTEAVLHWTAPSTLNGATITGYALRVATNDAFSAGLQTFTVSASVFDKTLTTLVAGTTYYAQVWANSSNGLGGYSDILSFTTLAVSANGLYFDFGSGPVFCEVWYNDAGTFKLCEPWQNVGTVSDVWKVGVS